MTISTESFIPVIVGTTSNDGTGDTLRNAFIKVNANFDAITEIGFDAGNINVAGSIEAQGNITASNFSGNVSFTMANTSHWTSSVYTIEEALNQLAERIYNIENP